MDVTITEVPVWLSILTIGIVGTLYTTLVSFISEFDIAFVDTWRIGTFDFKFLMTGTNQLYSTISMLNRVFEPN